MLLNKKYMNGINGCLPDDFTDYQLEVIQSFRRSGIDLEIGKQILSDLKEKFYTLEEIGKEHRIYQPTMQSFLRHLEEAGIIIHHKPGYRVSEYILGSEEIILEILKLESNQERRITLQAELDKIRRGELALKIEEKIELVKEAITKFKLFETNPNHEADNPFKLSVNDMIILNLKKLRSLEIQLEHYVHVKKDEVVINEIEEEPLVNRVVDFPALIIAEERLPRSRTEILLKNERMIQVNLEKINIMRFLQKIDNGSPFGEYSMISIVVPSKLYYKKDYLEKVEIYLKTIFGQLEYAFQERLIVKKELHTPKGGIFIAPWLQFVYDSGEISDYKILKILYGYSMLSKLEIITRELGMKITKFL